MSGYERNLTHLAAASIDPGDRRAIALPVWHGVEQELPHRRVVPHRSQRGGCELQPRAVQAPRPAGPAAACAACGSLDCRVLAGAIRRGGAHELVDVGPIRVGVEEDGRCQARPRESGRFRGPRSRCGQVEVGPDVEDGFSSQVSQRQDVVDDRRWVGQDPELGGEAVGA